MYTPNSFKEDDREVLHKLIKENGFGVFVSQTESGLMATHLPFEVNSTRGEHGTLVSHMARANPHWKKTIHSKDILVVFQGHTVTFPAWYQNQETVPTWNYAAVHAYGDVEFFDEPDRLKPILEGLVKKYESEREEPWPISKAADLMDAYMKAVVGIEIPIKRLEGKFKFNQNLSKEDQIGVIEALTNSSDSMESSVAVIMANNLK